MLPQFSFITPRSLSRALLVILTPLCCTSAVLSSSAQGADYTVNSTSVMIEESECFNDTLFNYLTGNGVHLVYRPGLFDFYGVICTDPSNPPSTDERKDPIVRNLETGSSVSLTPIDTLPNVIAERVVVSEDGRYTVFSGYNSVTEDRKLYFKDDANQSTIVLFDYVPDTWRFHTNENQVLLANYVNRAAVDFTYDIDSQEMTSMPRTGKFRDASYDSTYIRISHNKDSVVHYRHSEGQLYYLDIASDVEKEIDMQFNGVNFYQFRPLVDLSKNGRYAIWSASYPVPGTSYYESVIFHMDLVTGKRVKVDKSEGVISAKLSGNGRYVAMTQNTTDLDPSLYPDWATFQGIGLYDSFSNTTQLIENYACSRDEGSYAFNSCQNSGQIRAISDDGMTVAYDGGPSIVVLNIEKNSHDDSYTDVSSDFWANDAIERLDNAGIAGQCKESPRAFCPLEALRHDVSAQWLVKAIKGADYQPVSGSGTRFADVPGTWWAVDWIEEIDRLNVDRGFGNSFRPAQKISRAQFAYFLVRAKYGPNFTPPAASGQAFVDVPASHWAAPYIEQLRRDGIVSGGCKGNKQTYCPSEITKRATAAIMITAAFRL